MSGNVAPYISTPALLQTITDRSIEVEGTVKVGVLAKPIVESTDKDVN